MMSDDVDYTAFLTFQLTCSRTGSIGLLFFSVLFLILSFPLVPLIFFPRFTKDVSLGQSLPQTASRNLTHKRDCHIVVYMPFMFTVI